MCLEELPDREKRTFRAAGRRPARRRPHRHRRTQLRCRRFPLRHPRRRYPRRHRVRRYRRFRRRRSLLHRSSHLRRFLLPRHPWFPHRLRRHGTQRRTLWSASISSTMHRSPPRFPGRAEHLGSLRSSERSYCSQVEDSLLSAHSAHPVEQIPPKTQSIKCWSPSITRTSSPWPNCSNQVNVERSPNLRSPKFCPNSCDSVSSTKPSMRAT